MEISNRTMAWLVLATIVVSMFGTFISLNKLNGIDGLITSNTTGTATVAISSSTQLNFVIATIDFGTGRIEANGTGGYNCTMANNGSNVITQTSNCLSFNTVNPAGYLTLENAGNTYLNVTMNFSNNASTFIGAGGGSNANASLKFTVSNNESNSCASINTTLGVWTEVTTPSMMHPLCTGMEYANANDTLAIGIQIVVPANAEGAKTLTMIAQGTG